MFNTYNLGEVLNKYIVHKFFFPENMVSHLGEFIFQ